MTDSSTVVLSGVRRERRIASPYDIDSKVQKALEGTRLVVGHRLLANDEAESVRAETIPDPIDLRVEVDLAALAELRTDWGLAETDIRLVRLVETATLGLIDAADVSLAWSSEQATQSISVAMPEWLPDALGRTKIDVRCCVVLDRERPDAPIEQARARAAILAEWSAELAPLAPARWFAPKLLDEATRERLSQEYGCRLARETQIYVEVAEGLFDEQPLQDVATVYLDPETAGYLQFASGHVADFVESTVAERVLARIFDEAIAQLPTAGPTSLDGVAVGPILDILAKALKTDRTEIVAKMRMPQAREGLRTHLQAAAKVRTATTAAMK